MFYEPKDGHGLKHNPFNAIVTPRPIGWISTRGPDGQDNLAPYSFFNATSYTPPQLMFCSTGTKPDRGDTKDSLAQIRSSGVFCVNIAGYAQREAVNQSSGPWDAATDEFALTGLDKAECHMIDCPRVAAAPANLECRLDQVIPLKGKANFMVLAEVIGIHLRDDCLSEGRFDVLRFQPLARLGYRDYTSVTEVFEMVRPG